MADTKEKTGQEPEPITKEARAAVESLLELEKYRWEEDVRTIHARMIDILAELPAIGKDSRNTQQNFMYRSHDDVLNALNPLLAKHGVVVVPEVLERVASERTTGGGKSMYEVNLRMRFTFYGAQGDSVVGSTWGEGTDMGDKATNKAMTMAFKAVLAQAFAVSTAESYDTDGQTNEETTRSRSGGETRREPSAPAVVRPKGWTEWTKRMAELGVPPEDSAEWLRQASEGVDVATSEGKATLFQKACAVLVALTKNGAVTFDENARGILQKLWADAFDGLAIVGPAWRLSPTETELPTKDEYAAGATTGNAAAASDAEDIPF